MGLTNDDHQETATSVGGHGASDRGARIGDGSGSGPRVVALAPVKLPSAAASEAMSFLAMLDRMVRDPTVDPDRVERFTALYERSIARSAKSAFDSALSEMQPQMPIIRERGVNKDSGSKFALWEDVAEAVMSVTAQHGFSLTFRVKPVDKLIEVTAILAHRDGHREETSFPFPHDTTGSKNPIQAVGSSISYGKRYTACAILNIVSTGEDDDGAGAIKQMSSAEGKRNGTDRLFNEIAAEIQSAINVEMLLHIGENRKDEVDAMPNKWRALLRDQYSDKLDELRAAQR